MTSRREQSGDKHYVYTHSNKDGEIFYVGMGKGDRAWEKTGRHKLWAQYLENIGGEYTITIVERDLDEESAIELERRLIEKHSHSLINWINADRHGDWGLIAKYWELRKQNDKLFLQAKATEMNSLEDAVALYKEGLIRVMKYLGVLMSYYDSEVSKATGMAKKVYQDYYLSTYIGEHDLRSLDRLTLCLKKLGRLEEAKEEAEKFFKELPCSESRTTAIRIKKRISNRQAIDKKLLHDDLLMNIYTT